MTDSRLFVTKPLQLLSYVPPFLYDLTMSRAIRLYIVFNKTTGSPESF
jgi:hypothetical protein